MRPRDIDHVLDDVLSSTDILFPVVKRSIQPKKGEILFIVLLLGLLLLLSRTFFLQMIQGASYHEIAEENRIRIQNLKAPRGVFYDREGTLLARNIPNFSLVITPRDLPNDEGERRRILQRVGELLRRDPTSLEQIETSISREITDPIEIQDQLHEAQALLLKIETRGLPGVTIDTKASREYLYPDIMAHTIGYLGKITNEEWKTLKDKNYLIQDIVGKSGLEFSYEETLRGKDGKKRIEVDSQGKEKKVVAMNDPEAGKSLTLSINLSLATVLFEALQKSVLESPESTGGSAIAIDPRSGEVLALVSFPNYDSNRFVKGLSEEEYQQYLDDQKHPLFFRAISGQYPSGSTIKPLIAAIALEEHIITPKTMIMSTGGISIGTQFFPDWKTGGHGITDVKKALSESVNTFFYTVGGGTDQFSGLGIDRIRHYGELFGLGKPLGIDLPGEAPGLLPSKSWKENVKKERWYLGDTYHLAIGQGDLLVTPLQVASFTAAIAQNGTLFRPHLIRAVLNPKNNEKTIVSPQILQEHIIDPEHLRVVREGLRQAVTEGSARALASLPIAIAGKTGTAQFDEHGNNHAWFTGFAPYDNPEIVITVIVERGGEGHARALPVAAKGFEWYVAKKT